MSRLDKKIPVGSYRLTICRKLSEPRLETKIVNELDFKQLVERFSEPSVISITVSKD